MRSLLALLLAISLSAPTFAQIKIEGPERIEVNTPVRYDVPGLTVEKLKNTKVKWYPRSGLIVNEGLSWDLKTPYLWVWATPNTVTSTEGKLLLWITVDNPPVLEHVPGNPYSKEVIHVPDEYAEVEISIGPPPPPPDPPTISVSDVTVKEDDGPLELGVLLSKPAPAPVTFEVATGEWSAKEGTDFSPVSRTVTIPAGQSSTSITIPIVDDEEPEPKEYFNVSIMGVTNAVPHDLSITVNIEDDDKPLVTELLGAIVHETEDPEQQDPLWAQIMYGPTFNDLLGQRDWQPIDADAEGAPDWVNGLIAKTEEENLTQPQLFLLDKPTKTIVWYGHLSKDINEVREVVDTYRPKTQGTSDE